LHGELRVQLGVRLEERKEVRREQGGD
jgi:hypothetical protein